MNRWIVYLTLPFLLLFPKLCLSDAWEDFQEFNNGFYFLDDQQFKTLSCNVALPEFQDMLNETRNQIQAAGKNLLIEENLTDFRLVFSKSGNLRFIKPDITIQIGETEVLDKANLETRARMIESGFRTTVDGAIMTLQGLFNSYFRPAQPEYRVESFQREDDKVYIRYEQQGVLTDVVCSGMMCKKTVTTAVADVVNVETYMSAGEEKIIEAIHGTIEQPSQTMASTLSITYQVVEGLRIPQKINAQSTITHSMGSMNGAFSIALKDCLVE